MQEEEPTLKIDPLKLLFIETRARLIKEDELMEKDLTDFYYRWKRRKLARGELINITIRGEVATGKSTVAIAEMWDTLKTMKTMLKQKMVDPYTRIFSDQTEFIRFIQGDQKDTSVVIDEFNRMAETGLNATTETHLFDYYSDVFAQKNIHRYNCAPYYIMDKNSQVILDILTPQRDKKITTCKLLYREPTERQMLLLGIVHIDVKDVIKQDFYRKYRKKKFKRMELLDKHGIRDIREMEFAGLVLETYEQLKDVAKIGRTSYELILSTTTAVVRKNKRIYSLLTKQEIASRAKSLLGLYTELNKIRKKEIKKTEKLTPQELEKAESIILEQLKKGLTEEHKLKDIYEKYKKIT